MAAPEPGPGGAAVPVRPVGPPRRTLRADARRNHEAIVAAAREAFAEVGPDVPLEEVARRAGVGASTLYRRFSGREDLVAAVFTDYFDEHIEPLLSRAVADPDPGRGLVTVLEGIAGAVVHHREVLRMAKDAGAFSVDVVARFLDPLEALLARARAAGVVRDDLVARDLPVLVVMVVATAVGFDDRGGPVEPHRWDRYLALLLDALAPGAKRAPLPAPPPPPA